MPFDRAFLELMPETVTVSTRAGHTLYGEPTWGSSTTSYRARVVRKSGWVRVKEQEMVRSNTVVWIASTGTINIGDKINLPDGTAPEVLIVETFPDTAGPHHVKVFCGH